MEDKVTLYSYVKRINKKYVQKMGVQANRSASEALDAILDAIRLGTEVSFKDKKPKSFEVVEKMKLKRKNKLRALRR